jgi:hypothetical protein
LEAQDQVLEEALLEGPGVGASHRVG